MSNSGFYKNLMDASELALSPGELKSTITRRDKHFAFYMNLNDAQEEIIIVVADPKNELLKTDFDNLDLARFIIEKSLITNSKQEEQLFFNIADYDGIVPTHWEINYGLCSQHYYEPKNEIIKDLAKNLDCAGCNPRFLQIKLIHCIIL